MYRFVIYGQYQYRNAIFFFKPTFVCLPIEFMRVLPSIKCIKCLNTCIYPLHFLLFSLQQVHIVRVSVHGQLKIQYPECIRILHTSSSSFGDTDLVSCGQCGQITSRNNSVEQVHCNRALS